MTMLSINNMGKVFDSNKGEVTALEDINLTVDRGELAVIVGPSGCGKSTLLNIVAGLEQATSARPCSEASPSPGLARTGAWSSSPTRSFPG